MTKRRDDEFETNCGIHVGPRNVKCALCALLLAEIRGEARGRKKRSPSKEAREKMRSGKTSWRSSWNPKAKPLPPVESARSAKSGTKGRP